MATKILAVLLIAGACACLHGETRSGALPFVAPVVGVFYSFENTPSPDIVLQMQDELVRILAPSGLRLAWRRIEENRGDENYPEVVVVRFRGVCEMGSPFSYGELGPDSGAHELAETQRTNGKVLPFGDVECNHLSRYLSSVGSSESQAVRNGIFGRAMARVLAHEIFHMLTGSSSHSKQGIARASHSREELTAKKFDFAKADMDWLREWRLRSFFATAVPAAEIADATLTRQAEPIR